MGLPLYVAPVESDVRHKTASQQGVQSRSRARGSRARSTEFLRETRRRAILAATTAVRNRRDSLFQDTAYADIAGPHRPFQDHGEHEEQTWQHPGADGDFREFHSAVVHGNDTLPSGAPRHIDALPATRSTVFPITARDHFGRRRPLDRALDSSRYNPYSDHDADNLLALFSEHWASIGPGIDSLPGSTDEGAAAHRSGSGGPVQARNFGTDGTAEEGLSQFGTESDTDGNAASSRATRFRRRRSERHASSLPLGRAYSTGRPTVGWSDNQERPRSRSPVSSSRIFGNMSHLRGAEVIYPEERTRHTARVERYRTNLLNRAARRSARNSPRATDGTTDAHRSGNDGNGTSTASPPSADANLGTSQTMLPSIRYILGTSLDGLGDRQRSLSPEGDGVWDTLQTTVTPDPQPPSVSSSFASFPSGGAAVEHSRGHDDEDTDFTMPPIETAMREPAPGADDGDDDDTLTLDRPLAVQVWPAAGSAADGTGTREGAGSAGGVGGALPSPGATSASTTRSRQPGYAAHAYSGLPGVSTTEEVDCIEGSEGDDHHRVRSGDYTLPEALLANRSSSDRPDDGLMGVATRTSMTRTPSMSVMQQLVRNLSQRQDIPDDWWAEVGLSRTLP